MENLDRIITAQDYSIDEGADGTVLGRLRKMQEAWRIKGHTVKMVTEVRGAEVHAEINQGAWVAACECGGLEFVAPCEPIFFCWSCVNRGNDGYFRAVVFPENWEEIEAQVLKRPVNDVRGVTDKDRAYLAAPVVVFSAEDGTQIPATRSWLPGETVEDLEKQNAVIQDVIDGKVE